MCSEEIVNMEELERAIQQWESAVEWIAKGWDDIDESIVTTLSWIRSNPSVVKGRY
jgi:hypothetical protein